MSKIAVATYPFKADFDHSLKTTCSLIVDFSWNIKKPKFQSIEFNKEAFDSAKLIIFTGGEDINPKIYKEENKYSYFNDIRDEAEILVLKMALESNKKILGVCRGHQLINAYLGGKLVQDLKMDLNEVHGGYHELVLLTDKSLVLPYFLDGVNSMHHQGVIVPGNGLVPTSFYNGVYESCESDNIITVQFHPEFMHDQQSKNFFNQIKLWANLGE